MADWDDDDWEQDDDEFDRRQKSSGSKTLWIVLGLAGGGVLLMLICGGVFIAAMVNEFNNPGQGLVLEDLFVDNTPVEMPSAEVESPDEKQRKVVAAFRAEDVGVDDATLKAIEKLFDELLEGCDGDNYDGIAATFDIDRFLLQTKKTGVIKDMTVSEESQLRESLVQSTANVSMMRKHSVIHVDPHAGRREFVVYAYLWDEEYAGHEMRWWVVRNGGTFRFFDLEYLDFGMPESITEAIYQEYADDPGIDEFVKATGDIDKAMTASADGNREQAAASLRRAAGRRVFSQLADDVTLRIAYAWGTMGVTPPVIEPIRMTEELHIRLRPDALAFHGVTRAYVAKIVQTAMQGEVISQVLEGQRRFDLLVRLEEEYRTDYANLGRLRIDLPDGRGQIELRELADIERGTGPNAVNRENARRRMVIRCNTQDRDLASAVAEIQQRVQSQVELPEGYFIEYGGQFESQQRATRTILMLAGVSVIGMFVVLMILFPSVRVVLQILNALPTAFIGGVLALVITNQSLTVASLVGFISLGGIAVRNGILLVTHYFHLMKEEGEDFSREMVLRGSLERLAPVLMTAFTAGIGLIPLVLGGQEPGREILYPVATVILGGLFTSTFCEFLIHPGLFWKFSGKDAARLARLDESIEELTH